MKMRDYNIVFSGLKLGQHHFNYKLDQKFFDLFEYQEIERPEFEVALTFEKTNTMLELDFNLKGEFTAFCDLTNEPFQLPVTNHFHLIVKFGDTFNNDNDEILVLPFDDYELNVAQQLFELAVLAIPVKKVHPDVENGKMKSDILKYIKQEDEKKEETDPRWDKLKDLLNKQ